MFASIDEGDTLDNGVMVAGYVVMRVPMVFLWCARPARTRARRPAAMTYIWTIAVAQVGWVALVDRSTCRSRRRSRDRRVLIAIEMAGRSSPSAQGRDAVARRITSPSATGCS